MSKLNSDKPVAIFDFDGTITQKSTTLPFLKFIQGQAYSIKVLFNLKSLIAYKFKKIDIDDINHVISNAFFKGLTVDHLNHQGRLFSEIIIPSMIKESAQECIEWHQKQGHFCILATAAYDIYIQHWSKLNQFDECVSTHVEFDQHGIATGRIKGKSCYGDEKLRRVLSVIGKKPREVFAYGDSEGDKAILQYASHAFFRSFN